MVFVPKPSVLARKYLQEDERSLHCAMVMVCFFFEAGLLVNGEERIFVAGEFARL